MDRIIDHLKLTFAAAKPPPSHIAYHELLMAAEAGSDYGFLSPFCCFQPNLTSDDAAIYPSPRGGEKKLAP